MYAIEIDSSHNVIDAMGIYRAMVIIDTIDALNYNNFNNSNIFNSLNCSIDSIAAHNIINFNSLTYSYSFYSINSFVRHVL